MQNTVDYTGLDRTMHQQVIDENYHVIGMLRHRFPIIDANPSPTAWHLTFHSFIKQQRVNTTLTCCKKCKNMQ